MKKYRLHLTATLLSSAVLISGCSSLPSLENKVDYKSAEAGKNLEVPPDLTAPADNDRYAVPESGSATYSSYNKEQSQQAETKKVLPQLPAAHLEHAAGERWLVVEGKPEAVWPKVKEFLSKNNYPIKNENPEIGLIETDWMKKNLEVEETGIRKFLSRAMSTIYSTSERDKYLIRLERASDGKSTEIYVSHRGAEEVLKAKNASGVDDTIWQPRPSDPNLEAAMLEKLMVALGVAESDAKAQTAAATPARARAKLLDNAVSLDDAFDRSWHRVGIALDHIGFTVEDQDRARGLYFVRYVEPETKTEEGFLSGLAFWKSKPKAEPVQYRIRVTAAGAGSEVSVLDKEGNAERSDAERKILNLLFEQLK